MKATDPCPRCAGTLAPVRIPTDAEYAKAFDRENPGMLPEFSDTASPAQRAELGDLHRCDTCGYQTRIKSDGADADADADADDGAAAGAATGARRRPASTKK